MESNVDEETAVEESAVEETTAPETEQHETEQPETEQEAEPEPEQEHETENCNSEQTAKSTNLTYPFLKKLGKLGKPCGETCRKYDCKKFSIRDRKDIFNEFWIEFNSTERLMFIQSSICIGSKNEQMFYFKLDNQKLRVCRTLFSGTIGIHERDVQKIINEMSEKGSMVHAPTPSTDPLGDPLEGVGKIEHIEVNVEIDSIMHEDHKPTPKKISSKKRKKGTKGGKKTGGSGTAKKPKPLPKTIFKEEPPETDEENDFDNPDDDDESYKANSGYDSDEVYSARLRKSTIKREIGIRSDSEDLSSDSSTDDDEPLNEYETKPEALVVYSDGTEPPKEMGPPCTSELCRKIPDRKCYSLQESQRQHFFNTFWSIGNSDRVTFCKNNVELRYVSLKSLQGLPVYYLTDSSGKFLVCSKMFHSTLAIQDSTVLKWIFDNKTSRYLNTLRDQNLRMKRRDCNFKRLNKITYERVEILDDFLDLLPKIPPKSFVPQKSNKNYLHEEYTGIRKVYEEYKVTCMKLNEKYLSRHLLKKRLQFKQILIYKGRKLKEIRIENDPVLSPELKVNIKHAQQERFKDNALVKKFGSEVILLEMDILEKMVPNKHNDADLCESTERLCCYNLTVSNSLTGHSQCYWFCEIDCEIDNPSSYITCLLHYLNTFCQQGKQIIIYLTRPVFKNLDTANALLDYAIRKQVTIIQKFIPKEKSQTVCETIFQSIERKLRRLEIYLPSDYLTASSDCKKEMITKMMNFTNFKDYSIKSKKHRYFSLNTEYNKNTVNDFQALMYKPSGEICYKINFEEDWLNIPEANRNPIVDLNNDWIQLYLERRKITPVKYQLLQSLKNKMPRDCHFFYDYLTIEI